MIKGLLYLNPWRMVTRGFSTLILLKGRSKGLLYLDPWWMVTKGLLYPDLAERSIKGASLPSFELLKCWSKGFFTSIWVVEMTIKRLLYFDLNYWNADERASLLRSELLKCRSKVLSISIWAVEMPITGLFYFDLSCWNVNQSASLLWFELLKCRLKGFSTLILNCWNVD